MCSSDLVTRDYKLILNNEADHAPLLSVFGGKITTYRKLAENAVNKLAPFYPKMSKPCTLHSQPEWRRFTIE